MDLGANLSSHFASNVTLNPVATGPTPTQSFKRGAGSASFTVGYGLPGKPDYSYERPFDYFNLVALDSTNAVESVFSRGLLYGTDYDIGPAYRGVWVSTASMTTWHRTFPGIEPAGAFGTTAQWWLSNSVALQGTALAGLGYAAGGVILGSGVTSAGPTGEGKRNYHYGVAPEAVLAARLLRRPRRPRYHRPRLLHQPSGRHGTRAAKRSA